MWMKINQLLNPRSLKSNFWAPIPSLKGSGCEHNPIWLWVFILPEGLPPEQGYYQLITPNAQKRSIDWGATTHYFVYINLPQVCTLLLVQTSPSEAYSINHKPTVCPSTHTRTHTQNCKSRPLKAKFMNALSSWRHGQNLRAVLFGKADEELLF